MAKEITCKLTGVRGPGVKAHIIPRSFYDFDKMDHKPAKVIHLAGEKTRVSNSPVGEYDATIVTAEGEAYFSEPDAYACECLVRRGQNANLYHDGVSPLCIEIADFDYPKLKMFFLSLLWRAGVTSRPLFRHVELGPHEERIRQMILAKDPGDSHAYSVILGIHRDTPPYGLPMLEPEPHCDDTGTRFYRFSLGHLIACIKVDQQPYGPMWEDFVLSPNAPLRFIILDDFTSSPLYKNLVLNVPRPATRESSRRSPGSQP